MISNTGLGFAIGFLAAAIGAGAVATFSPRPSPKPFGVHVLFVCASDNLKMAGEHCMALSETDGVTELPKDARFITVFGAYR